MRSSVDLPMPEPDRRRLSTGTVLGTEPLLAFAGLYETRAVDRRHPMSDLRGTLG